MTTAVPGSTPRAPSRDADGMHTVRLDDDRRLVYAEYGDPDGRPVVFLHGTPGSRLLGGLFDDAAREAGVRLLAPDRPGYGRSTPWSDRSVGDAPQFIAAVVDDAGESAAGLVAFSGGAPHALATAAARPDRVTRVDVVSGATPPAVSESTPAVQRLLAGMAGTTPRVLRGLLRGGAWLADRMDPSVVVGQYTTGDRAGSVPDDAAAIVRADFVEAFAATAAGAATEFRNAAADWEVPFGAIETEVHLRHGGADANVPVDGVRRLARRIPTASLTVLEDADHLGALLEGVPDVLRAQGGRTDGGGGAHAHDSRGDGDGGATTRRGEVGR